MTFIRHKITKLDSAFKPLSSVTRIGKWLVAITMGCTRKIKSHLNCGHFLFKLNELFWYYYRNFALGVHSLRSAKTNMLSLALILSHPQFRRIQKCKWTQLVTFWIWFMSLHFSSASELRSMISKCLGRKAKVRISCWNAGLGWWFLPHHTVYLLVVCLSGSNLKFNIMYFTDLSEKHSILSWIWRNYFPFIGKDSRPSMMKS